MLRVVTAAALALGFLALEAAPAFASTTYTVYCARGRIEVETRSLAQMRQARGSNVCQMGQGSTTRSSAVRLADRNHGGIGAACSCR